MSSQSICIFCECKSKNLTKFTKETLNKCQEVLLFRKENYMKFSDIVLPNNPNNTQGYHSKCYEDFSSLKNMMENELKGASCTMYFRGEAVSYSPDSTEKEISKEEMVKALEKKTLSKTQIQRLKDVCLICMENKNSNPESFHKFNESTLEHIKSWATMLNDIIMLKRFETVESQNVTSIMYHDLCKQNYAKTFKNQPKETNDWWKRVRNNHQTAYKKVCSSVNEQIVKQKKCYLLKYLEYEYLEALHAAYGYQTHDIESKFFGTNFLEPFLLKTFANQISLVEINKEKVLKPSQGVENEHIYLEELQKDVGALLMAIYLQQHSLHFNKTETFNHPLLDNMKHLVKAVKNMHENESEKPEIEKLVKNIFTSNPLKLSDVSTHDSTKLNSSKDISKQSSLQHIPVSTTSSKTQADSISEISRTSSDLKLPTGTKSLITTIVPKTQIVSKSAGTSRTSNSKLSTGTKSSSASKLPTGSKTSVISETQGSQNSSSNSSEPRVVTVPCYLDVQESSNRIMVSLIPANVSHEAFLSSATAADNKCPAKKTKSSKKHSRLKSRLLEID